MTGIAPMEIGQPSIGIAAEVKVIIHVLATTAAAARKVVLQCGGEA